MLNNIIIQKAIEELKIITKVNLCVININSEICATTFNINSIKKEYILDFLKSTAEIQVINEYNFFKVEHDSAVVYIVIAKNTTEDSNMIGKIFVSQLKSLITVYKEKLNKNSFIQNIILDNNIFSVDLYSEAKHLGIKNNVNRVVIIVSTDHNNENNSLEMIKNIFAENENDFIMDIDEKSIIILKDLDQRFDYEEVKNISSILVDMFNTEIMIKVKVSYGTIINDLKNISKSYKEAKMSMEIGNIFYKERNIIGYNTLGIGRIIYQLPLNLCKMFINEVFKEHIPESLDQETITIIHKFFENNLNISETARKLYIHRNTLIYRLEKIQRTTGLDIKVFDDAVTFKLVLMIFNYMKYRSDRQIYNK